MTIPLAAELSVLIGFGGWGKQSLWSVVRRVTAIFPLWNSPPTSDSAVDATKCLRILNSVYIGQLIGGGRFGDFSVSFGSEIR